MLLNSARWQLESCSQAKRSTHILFSIACTYRSTSHLPVCICLGAESFSWFSPTQYSCPQLRRPVAELSNISYFCTEQAIGACGGGKLDYILFQHTAECLQCFDSCSRRHSYESQFCLYLPHQHLLLLWRNMAVIIMFYIAITLGQFRILNHNARQWLPWKARNS